MGLKELQQAVVRFSTEPLTRQRWIANAAVMAAECNLSIAEADALIADEGRDFAESLVAKRRGEALRSFSLTAQIAGKPLRTAFHQFAEVQGPSASSDPSIDAEAFAKWVNAKNFPLEN